MHPPLIRFIRVTNSILACLAAVLVFATSGRAGEGRAEPKRLAELRLLTPLSSNASFVGSPFKAVVISAFTRGTHDLIPVGSLVHGVVSKRTAVGLGLIHERAHMSLRFDSYELADGQRLSLRAKLLSIENARESVDSNGQIRGIMAADSPQGVLGGVWFKPSMAAFPRSFVGLSGVAGELGEHFVPGPIGAVSLLAIRCAMFRMPDPEIQLPLGTELSIGIEGVPQDAPEFDSPPAGEVPVNLAEALESQDYKLSRSDGRPVRDIINLALLGSRETILAGFQGAGWVEAQPLSGRSKYRMLGAYIAQTGYSEAPASELFYEGEKPDLIIEKSLNDIFKRDHVRIWKTTFEGREVWLGAATRDKGVGFDAHGLAFTHRIQSDIDVERQKIVSDLVFSGCSDPAGFVTRPNLAFSGGANVVTDGRVVVLQMRPCTALSDSAEIGKIMPTGNLVKRFARRLVLEGRQYAERESAAYWLYRIGRWSYKGFRGAHPEPRS